MDVFITCPLQVLNTLQTFHQIERTSLDIVVQGKKYRQETKKEQRQTDLQIWYLLDIH
jgi:hypothetical protein